MVRLSHHIHIDAPIERCFDLARSIEVHLLRNIHWGAPARAIGATTSGLAKMGQRVTWRARHFYLWHSLTSEITGFRPPFYFQDTMRRGPFRWMRHDHHFRALPLGVTEMEDHFCFAAPLPVLGRLAEAAVLRGEMPWRSPERSEEPPA